MALHLRTQHTNFPKACSPVQVTIQESPALKRLEKVLTKDLEVKHELAKPKELPGLKFTLEIVEKIKTAEPALQITKDVLVSKITTQILEARQKIADSANSLLSGFWNWWYSRDIDKLEIARDNVEIIFRSATIETIQKAKEVASFHPEKTIRELREHISTALQHPRITEEEHHWYTSALEGLAKAEKIESERPVEVPRLSTPPTRLKYAPLPKCN